jgi:hypothetical protein
MRSHEITVARERKNNLPLLTLPNQLSVLYERIKRSVRQRSLWREGKELLLRIEGGFRL